MAALPADRVRFIDALRVSPDDARICDGACVFVVRYVPLPWLRMLTRMQGSLARIVYLLDDDIPAALRAPELPFLYALRTAWRYASMRRLLARLCGEVWVSTTVLQQRYPASAPVLCEPRYVAAASQAARENCYFYHGTWAHRREIEWLVPVIRAVQDLQTEVVFEIFGGKRVRRLFDGIPRVRVRAPMNWPDYLEYAGTRRFCLGLAPCFDTPFNRARSHVKLFDITRLGAAGIYSDVAPYSARIVHGKTGVLCANDADEWVGEIIRLLRDDAARRTLHAGALEWCRQADGDDCPALS
jgi:hypothetical protein